MSRLLGIDYGQKRIGLAVSDEKRLFAFSFNVIKNDKSALEKIIAIIKEKKIKKIVLGLPLSIANQAQNPILKSVEKFKKKLEKDSAIPVVFESEIYTTKEAERIQGKHKKIDASAAALILKTYLSKLKFEARNPRQKRGSPEAAKS